MKNPVRQLSVEAELLTEISHKLDGVVTVLAMQAGDRDKQIELLALGGMDSPFIASLLGTTSATVRTYAGWKRVKKARTSVPLADSPPAIEPPTPPTPA